MSRRRGHRRIHQRAPHRGPRQPPKKKAISRPHNTAARPKRLPHYPETRPKVIPVLRKYTGSTRLSKRRIQNCIRLLRQRQKLILITQAGIHRKPRPDAPVVLQKPCPLLRIERYRLLPKALRKRAEAEIMHLRNDRRTPAIRIGIYIE